ncbi:MAG: hypothetical protein H7836_13090 [Magnetococcus sp. YQC-3]
MSKKILTEIYGIGSSPNMSHFQNLPDPFYGTGLDRPISIQQSPKNIHQFGHEFTNWQKQLYDLVIAKKDVFVSVPPAKQMAL